MNFKGKDCVFHVPQRLAGMDERVDNSCKRRAEYLRRSLVIVCRERGQWQASFIREKSACLAEVSVRFLLGTGRMPHPVGGAMGVPCVTAVKRETPVLKRSHI